MPLVLNEEQTLLKSTAEDFFRRKAPVSALRALRDDSSVDGFSRELWQEMVAMGWPGAFLPEQYGGLDCGFTELGVVLQASGRTLVASPLVFQRRAGGQRYPAGRQRGTEVRTVAAHRQR